MYPTSETHLDGAIMEPPKSSDLGLIAGGLGIIGLISGWIIGALRAAWALSKFESRVVALEKSITEQATAAKDFADEYAEEEVGDRLRLLESIADKLSAVPDLVLVMNKSVSAMEKVIFQERGGLNVITISEHEKMQFHCQSMFKKDLEHIKGGVEQVVKNSGVEELKRIEMSIARMENAIASRIRTDKVQRIEG